MKRAAAIVVAVTASVAAVVAFRARDEQRHDSPDKTTSTTAAEQVADGTFAGILTRGRPTSDGGVRVDITLLDGRSLGLTVDEDAVALLRPANFAERVPVYCNPSCGHGVAYVSATDSPYAAPPIATFPSSDGAPVLLVDAGPSKALRWIRPGWTVELPLASIPDSSSESFSTGLTPSVDSRGWLRVDLSNRLSLDSTALTGNLFAPGGVVTLAFRACTPSAEGPPAVTRIEGSATTFFGERCYSDTGAMLTVHADARSFVRTVLEGVTVG